jgi:hypothetical protein
VTSSWASIAEGLPRRDWCNVLHWDGCDALRLRAGRYRGEALGSFSPTDVVAALTHAWLARPAPGGPGRGLSLAFSDVGLSLHGQLRVSRHSLSVRARPSVGLGRGRRDGRSDPLLNRSDALGRPAAPSENKDHHETSKSAHDRPSGGSGTGSCGTPREPFSGEIRRPCHLSLHRPDGQPSG